MHSPALKFFIWGLVAAFALAAVIWADRRTYARWQREQEQVANGDASLRQPAHVEWQPVNLQDLTLQPSSFTVRLLPLPVLYYRAPQACLQASALFSFSTCRPVAVYNC